jgi:hypothetical protein
MSSKISIIFTKDCEHWYEESNETDEGKNRVYIEIDKENITYFNSEDNIIIGIKGNTEIAEFIKGRLK